MAAASGSFALLASEREAVAFWRNCDTLHLRTNAAQHPLGDERHRFGHRTSPVQASPGRI